MPFSFPWCRSNNGVGEFLAIFFLLQYRDLQYALAKRVAKIHKTTIVHLASRSLG